ncbi:MAG: trypsin-like peptidase domain-containing protein [Dehalococcoidia bacterium]
MPRELTKAGRIFAVPAMLMIVSFLLVVVTPGCDESATEREAQGIDGRHNWPGAVEPQPSGTSTAADTGCTAIEVSNQIADIVETVEPAVVFISAETEGESFFFGSDIQESVGSGVIMDSNGYIITNNHVVEGVSNLKVVVPGRIGAYEAEIIGTDPLTDLAVIAIEGQGFPTARFGNATALRPGNLVIAMGYPMALEQGATITLGVVSNIERAFQVGDSTYYDVIQTDAAINQGNSGGPLLDLNGGIVGINSVLFGGAQNIGFAISANTAQQVYKALVGDEHRVIRPWLGVVLADVTPELAAEAGLSGQSGVVISGVVEGSPADAADLRVKDVITRFEGERVTSASQLIKELWRHQIGDKVSIEFWRGGEKMGVDVELTVERPQ